VRRATRTSPPSALLIAALAFVLAPAVARAADPAETTDAETTAAEAPVADDAAGAEEATSPTDADPFQTFNRAMFDFNDSFDTYALEPVARGYDKVVPHRAQTSIGNFYDNLLFPIRFVNDLLQGEVDPAAVTLVRFAVNTTVGVGGLFDPATDIDLPAHRADFGQTLGKWGAPPGPYLVWPVWGSSNVRDTVGILVDAYFGIQTFFVDLPILIGSTAVNAVNRRALALETVSDVRDASFDLYSAARNAYNQQRDEMIKGEERARAERDADLYFFEDLEEEDVEIP